MFTKTPIVSYGKHISNGGYSGSVNFYTNDSFAYCDFSMGISCFCSDAVTVFSGLTADDLQKLGLALITAAEKMKEFCVENGAQFDTDNEEKMEMKKFV